MKKGYILVAAVVMTAFCGSAAAQEFHLGIEAGATVSNASWKFQDGRTTKSVGGFTIGITGEYEILDNVWLQSGISFLTKGGKYEMSAPEEGFPNITRTTSEIYRPLYIQLPINVAYKINIKGNFGLFITGGGFLSQGIGGEHNKKIIFTGDSRWQNENVNQSAFSNDALKRFDCGLNVGAGLELGKLVVRAGYDWSVIDIVKDKSVLGTDKFKNRSFAIAVGLKMK